MDMVYLAIGLVGSRDTSCNIRTGSALSSRYAYALRPVPWQGSLPFLAPRIAASPRLKSDMAEDGRSQRQEAADLGSYHPDRPLIAVEESRNVGRLLYGYWLLDKLCRRAFEMGIIALITDGL